MSQLPLSERPSLVGATASSSVGTVDSAAPSSPELSTQAEITADTEAIGADRSSDPEAQPVLDYPPYRSSLLRHPTQALEPADPEGVELWAPVFGERDVDPSEADLTTQHDGEPIGERIVVTGRVLDGDGRPVRRQLVE